MLHEFMLPTVFPGTKNFKSKVLDAEYFPSGYFFCCESRQDELDFCYRGKFESVGSSPKDAWPIFDEPYKLRNILFLKTLIPRTQGVFFADMADARSFEAQVFFDEQINVLQFNRRRGNRNAVLWRLPGYFEPSNWLGHVDGASINDEIRFKDKLPVVFWRGDISGCHWINPKEMDLATRKQSVEEMKRSAHVFSRYKAVFDVNAQCDFADIKFFGRMASKFEDLKSGGFVDEYRSPSEFLKYKYILCLNGNCLATQLYWVIKTRSLAFREECEYESIPDYFLKPWVHYIPIAKGLHDLKEKFEFCERNADMCHRIIDRANMAHEEIQKKEIWNEAEDIVLDRLGILRC